MISAVKHEGARRLRGAFGLAAMIGVLAAFLSVYFYLPAQAAKKPSEVSAGRVVVAGVPANWPPHYSLDGAGRPSGFAIDVIEEIAQRIGVVLEYRIFPDFRSVSNAWRRGEIDIIPNSGITAERRENALFTTPIDTFTVSTFVLRGQSQISSPQDLEGRRVSVVAHNIGHRMLKDRNDLTLVVHPDMEQALFSLLSGKTDAMVFPRPVLLKAARSIGVEDNIEALLPSLKTIERGIRVKKNETQLHEALDRAVAGFVNTPEYWAIHKKWFGAPTPFWSTQRVIYTCLGAIVLIILVMALWRYRSVMRLNQRLRESLLERQLIEEDLSRTKSQLEDAIESISEAFVLFDADERLVICNSKYKQLNQAASDIIEPGARFEDIVRCAVSDDHHPSSKGRTEEWVEERLIQFREARGAREHKYADGRSFYYSERKTKDGGTVGIRTEITKLKQAEEALGHSEARFRDFATSTSDWFWEMDEQLRFSFISSRFLELTGIPEETWLGRTAEEVGRSDSDEADWRQRLEDMQERRPFRNFIYQHKQDNGRIWWFAISATPVFDGNGRFVGYRGTGTDITRQKRTEDLLRVSQHRLEAIMNHIPAAMFLKDLDARYLLVNNQFQEWFGVDPSEIVGKTAHDIYPAERAAVYADSDRRILTNWEVVTDDVDIPGPNGEDKNYTLTKFPIFDAGEPVGFGGVMMDITERKKTERALRQSENRAEMANRAKSEFLANMSHELRTPLNAIIGFAEIIRSGVFGADSVERNQEYAKDIYESGQHLLDLINDILDLSKIELGSEGPKEVDVSVPQIIDAVMVLMKERAREADIRIVTEYADDLPLLNADERKLKQILINLMSNSIKFTLPGGKITLSARCEPGEGYSFEVSDTGIGIAPEDIAKAMQPFGQIDSDLNRKFAGTGLGLPLSKELAEMHDGTLALESELKVGTTVKVSFPSERTVQPVWAELSPAIPQLP